MTLRICPNSNPCPTDQPLDNFSSESDDTIDFISTRYGYTGDQHNLWNRTICDVTVISNVSQSDADMRAAALAGTCEPCVGTDCGTKKITTFCNTLQTACVPCPDGTLACFDVAAGQFCGYASQAEADSAAFNFAWNEAHSSPVCIGSISQCACLGQTYGVTIQANQSVQWSFDGGTLPPGLLFTDGVGTTTAISGIPTVSGQYTFRLKATSPEGGYSTRTFTITVLEITTTQLAGYSTGVPYSFQLTAVGGSGNYLWKIISGSLPPGLTLSNTGLISGTPT